MDVSTDTIAASYYYDAFGNILESTGSVDNSICYAGYQYDEETGYYYLNARMYDPVTARFLQEDTYLGDPNDPLSLNLYVYCRNNPLRYLDPSGHIAIVDDDGWGGRPTTSSTKSKDTDIDRLKTINRQIKIRLSYIGELEQSIRDMRYNEDFVGTWQGVIDKQYDTIIELLLEKKGLLFDNPILEDKEVEIDIDLSPWDNDETRVEQQWREIVNGACDRFDEKDESFYNLLDWATFGWYGNVSGSFNRMMSPKASLNEIFGPQNALDVFNVASSVFVAGSAGAEFGNMVFGGTTPVLNGGGASPAPGEVWSIYDDAASAKSTLDYIDDITVTNGQYYAPKNVIDEIGKIEAKGIDFSQFDRSIISSRSSAEGGLSQVIKYSDERGVRFIIHKVTDGAGSVIHRDFDAVMIESGQLINKLLK